MLTRLEQPSIQSSSNIQALPGAVTCLLSRLQTGQGIQICSGQIWRNETD